MRRRRAGIALVVILGVFSVLLGGLGALHVLLGGDVRAARRIRREMEAAALARSIADQLVARARQEPWEQRFWLREMLVTGAPRPGLPGFARIAFDRRHGRFVRVADLGVAPGRFDYRGTIEDAACRQDNPGFHECRILLELTLDGERFDHAFEHRFESSLLGGVDRGGVSFGKSLPAGAARWNAALEQLTWLAGDLSIGGVNPVEGETYRAALADLARTRAGTFLVFCHQFGGPAITAPDLAPPAPGKWSFPTLDWSFENPRDVPPVSPDRRAFLDRYEPRFLLYRQTRY